MLYRIVLQFSYIKLQKKTQETKERLMDRQTDINRQEDMEMKRQAGRPTDIQTDRWTFRLTLKLTETSSSFNSSL